MNIIDLFSGAGGLTFGFYYRKKGNRFVRNRKNRIIFANEYDINASKAFKCNYPDVNMITCDIRKLSEDTILNCIGNTTVDLIIGGPPCQSFSTVGQRIYDEKATLYEEYYRILNIVRPKMFLFENVKGILSMKEIFYKRDENGNIIFEHSNLNNKESRNPRKKPVIDHYGGYVIDTIKKRFSNIDNNGFGYNLFYDTLNAVDYGIPENRERVFIIGVRNDLNISWEFPKPTCNIPLTIAEAISDLPVVNEGEIINNYNIPPQNDYQALMRANSEILTHHFCGYYGDKIRTVIRNVMPGQGKNDFNALVDAGVIDQQYKLTSGYANTYGRLISTQPSPTITNNLSTPSALRCIHYEQNRALTPREGARIQSFPDWFEFVGSKDNITTQIGNAVPPLLSMEIAKKIERILKE